MVAGAGLAGAGLPDRLAAVAGGGAAVVAGMMLVRWGGQRSMAITVDEEALVVAEPGTEYRFGWSQIVVAEHVEGPWRSRLRLADTAGRCVDIDKGMTAYLDLYMILRERMGPVAACERDLAPPSRITIPLLRNRPLLGLVTAATATLVGTGLLWGRSPDVAGALGLVAAVLAAMAGLSCLAMVRRFEFETDRLRIVGGGFRVIVMPEQVRSLKTTTISARGLNWRALDLRHDGEATWLAAGGWLRMPSVLGTPVDLVWGVIERAYRTRTLTPRGDGGAGTRSGSAGTGRGSGG